MMNSSWKQVSLSIAGERMEFIYDPDLDKVYPRLFPGIEIEPFTSACGMRIQPVILKRIILDKLIELEIGMLKALKEQGLNYDSLF